MKIYVIPSHHWDPFWAFSPDISEKMGVRNLRKALDIIRRRPDFKYTIGQVYLWELFQKHFPKKISELKQRINEGKIILVCGGYVNPDFNLPSGESLIRQISFNKRTWQEEFGINSEIVFIQDSFGNPASLPQIFSKIGLKFHTAKRGAKKDLPAVFIWQGTDGSQIIFDRQPLGHHGICLFPGFSAIPNRIKPWEGLEKIAGSPPLDLIFGLIALYLPDVHLWIATKGKVWRFKSALKYLSGLYRDEKIFVPHCFGFDGALPVGYISSLCKLHTLLSKDKMFIASPEEFFREIEKNNLEIIEGELNGPGNKDGEGFGALPGTHSTRIDVKQRTRAMERYLYSAELLEILKFLRNSDCRDLTEIWKLKFLTDFHDGICGSLSDANYKVLKEKGESVIDQCQKIIDQDLKEIAPRKAVFNPLPWPRKDLIAIDGELKLTEARSLGLSAIKTVAPEGKIAANAKEKALTTPFYKAGWSKELKISQGQRLITGPKFARFRLQKEKGDAYFYDVSRNPNDWQWDEIQSIKLVEASDVMVFLEIKSGFERIEITQRIKFYTHTPRIDFETDIHNRRKDIRLQAHFPLSQRTEGKIVREIPAGFLEEGKSPGQAKWEDVFGQKFAYYDNIKCAQNWIYLGGAAIFNDGLPEHELTENGCFLTLLRCVGRVGTKEKGFLSGRFLTKNVPWKAGGPWPIPLAQLQGSHEFKYAFYPGERKDIVRECYEFLFPLQFCRGNGSEISLMSISDKNVIILAVKKAERKNSAVVRLLETEGKEKEIEINLAPEINFQRAFLADLMEEIVSDLAIKNNILRLKIKPQEIITLILEK